MPCRVEAIEFRFQQADRRAKCGLRFVHIPRFACQARIALKPLYRQGDPGYAIAGILGPLSRQTQVLSQ
jgi:hypothetical protein